jgi:hypothetical protein
MQNFDEFIGRDLKLFGVDDEFIAKLKWMDQVFQPAFLAKNLIPSYIIFCLVTFCAVRVRRG